MLVTVRNYDIILSGRKNVISLHPIYADAAKKVNHELVPPYGKTRLKLIYKKCT